MSLRYGSLEERFHSQYIPEPNSGCWIWLGSIDESGYGRFRKDRKKVRVHRLSYEISNGPIPFGLNILHRCDMPCCVNPDHLFVGTKIENNADRTQKGRSAWGEQLHSTLSESQVHSIRAAIGSHREIAEQHGVSHVTIGRIKRGEKWANLPRNTK